MADLNTDTSTQSVNHTNKSSTRGSIVVASLLIIIGFITLYDAASYTDIDSKVFPQTSAIALILFSALAIAKQIMQPSIVSGIELGAWWRVLRHVAQSIPVW